MSESYITVPPNSTGANVRTELVTVSATPVMMEVGCISDPNTPANLLAIDSGGRITANINGTVSTSTNLTQIAGTAVNTATAGTMQVGLVGNAGGVMDAVGQNATSPANALLVSGQFNTSPTTITSGHVSPLQLDNAGNLLVNIKAGAGSGGTAIADEASFTQGTTNFTPIGGLYATSITNLSAGQVGVARLTPDRMLYTNLGKVGGAATSTAASGTQLVGIVGSSGNAFDANGQNATAPANQLIVGGQFNTSPTTITSGNVSPLQLDASGNLLVNIQAGAGSGGTALADEASFTQGTTNFTPIGGIYTTGPVNLTSGHAGVAQLTIDRMLYTNLGKVGGTAVGTAASGIQKVGIVGGTGVVLDFIGQNATSPANSLLIAGQFNTTPTTISSGNASPLQLDNAGNLLVNIKAGAGSGGTAISDETAFTEGTTSFTPIGGYYKSAITNLSSGQSGAVQLTADRNMYVNLNKISGTVASVGNGTTDSGTLRVSLSSDSTGQVKLAAGANTIGTVSATQGTSPWVVSQTTAANLNATVVVSGTASTQDAADMTGTAPGTAPSNTLIIGGKYNSSAPAPTNGQTLPVQLDSNGNLKVNIITGGAGANAAASTTGTSVPSSADYIGFNSGGNLVGVSAGNPLPVSATFSGSANPAAGATGSAVPADADYSGLNVGGTLRGQTGVNPTGSVYASQTDLTSLNGISLGSPSNYGTSPGAVPVIGINAYVTGGAVAVTQTTSPWITQDLDSVTQGSTTSGQNGGLVQGAVTTSAPTYTTAKTNPLSLTTAGALRVDGSGVTQPVSLTSTTITGTVACTQSGNWTARIVGNAGAILDAAGQNATSPANALLVSAQFNTTPTTVTSGNVSPLQMDNAGNLLVNIKAGSVSVGTVQIAGNGTILSGQQAVTSSATALATNSAKNITVKAFAANTIPVYIGPSGISISTGYELQPGDSITLPVTNTNLLYIIGNTPPMGTGVSWIGSV